MHKIFYIFIFSSLSLLASYKDDRFIRSLNENLMPKNSVSSFETDRNKAENQDSKHRRALERALLGVKPSRGPHEEIQSLPSHPGKRNPLVAGPLRQACLGVTKPSFFVDVPNIRGDSSSLLAFLPEGSLVIALREHLCVVKKNRSIIQIYELTPSHSSQDVMPYFTSVIDCPQYQAIAAATNDGRILLLHSTRDFRRIRTLNISGKVEAIAVNSSIPILASSSSLAPNSSRLSFHDLRVKEHEVASLVTENVSCLSFDPLSGNTIVSGGKSGVLRVWDVRKTDELKTEFSHHKSSSIGAVAWSPYNSHTIATAGGENICVVNEFSGKPYSKIKVSYSCIGLVWIQIGLLSGEGNRVHHRSYPDLENISLICSSDVNVGALSEIAFKENNLCALYPHRENKEEICFWNNLPIEETKKKPPRDLIDPMLMLR